MARETISLEQLNNFSVDDETNQLFWHGRAVVTEISLPWWVQMAAIVTGISTVILATVAVIGLFT